MGIGDYFNPTKPGVNLVTDGSEDCFVGTDKVESIRGNRREWTFGLTLETVGGTKTFVIHGMLTEVFVALKTELILQWETKINVGGVIQITIGKKNERTVAAHVELDQGPKYHLGIAGQKRIITADTFRSLKDTQIKEAWKRRMGVNFQWMATQFETYDTVVDDLVSVRRQAANIFTSANSALHNYKDCNVVCKSFKIVCSGALKFDPVGSLKVEAQKKFLLKGSSIKLDGGGATFEVNGGLKANTTALTYS